MLKTLHENDSHEENRTNKDNITYTSMYRQNEKSERHSASDTKEQSCHFEETYQISINIKSPFWSRINSDPSLQEKNFK